MCGEVCESLLWGEWGSVLGCEEKYRGRCRTVGKCVGV